MNEFFTAKRFQLLVFQHWAENRKRYLLFASAYLGVLMLWFLVAILAESQTQLDQGLQKATFYLSIFALGTTYASQYFSHFSSQAKGINFLLVPASHFEKMLCSLLYTVVLFLIMISVAFYMVDLPVTQLMKHAPIPSGTTNDYGTANVFDVQLFDFAVRPQGNLVLLYLSVQSVFLFGSVFFKKYSFLKTCICGLVAVFLCFILVYFSYKQAFDNNTVEILPDLVRAVIVTLTFVTPPVFWVLTYFRLKAKQV